MVGEGNLGLLLYRGGTVCNNGHHSSGYYARFTVDIADAICKEMNFTRAERWTTKESFGIQSNYDVLLWNVRCSSAYWGNCTYSENNGRSEIDRYCTHSKDVFLSCTGKRIF